MKNSMLRAVVVAVALLACPLAHAQQVTLRSQVEATGPAVTLGDLFENAGAVAGRAVGPAPGAGRSATFSPRFVQAAANAAGLQWTAPANMERIIVSGRGAAAAAHAQPAAAGASGDIAVRRGEIVTLVYIAPGMQLTARARASADASIGDTIRLVNLQSNRPVEATVTGIATASASFARQGSQ